MNCLKKYNLLTREECDIITKTILSIEEDVKRIGPSLYNGTSENSLTGRFYCFNFLSNEVIGSILKPKIKKLFGDSVVVQCWANIFRKGEGITEHTHTKYKTDGYFGGANVFLHGDPTIGTYYEGIKNINKIGEFVIFPDDMKHFVPPNPTDNIRVSIAFDFWGGSDEFMSQLVAINSKRFMIVK